MKRLIATVADDPLIEEGHPVITDMISCIGEASQIKTIRLHVPRTSGRIDGTRSLDPATGFASMSRINSKAGNHKGGRGIRKRGRWRSRGRRLEIATPIMRNRQVNRARRASGDRRRWMSGCVDRVGRVRRGKRIRRGNHVVKGRETHTDTLNRRHYRRVVAKMMICRSLQ
jgi:hypothetical protein